MRAATAPSVAEEEEWYQESSLLGGVDNYEFLREDFAEHEEYAALFGLDGDDDEWELSRQQTGSNPLIKMMFDFLRECTSSKPALVWGVLMALLVVIQLVCMTLTTINGPNFSPSASKYPFLPSADQYWQLYLTYYVPLVFDASVRLVVLAYVVFGGENVALFARLKRDSFSQCLFACDLLSIIPFVVFVTIKPQSSAATSTTHAGLPETARLVLRLLEILSVGRIVRLVKDVPAVAAFRVALGRSFSPRSAPLAAPFFFFVAFSATAANILLFVEPCYDTSTCAWTDLLDATFFTASAMTTAGYGGQVPRFEYARVVAVGVMLAGALVLAMPLAVIGNAYADALVEAAERSRLARKAAERPKARAVAGGGAGLGPSFAADMAPAARGEKPSSAFSGSATSSEADYTATAAEGGDEFAGAESVEQQQQRQRERRERWLQQELISAIHQSALVETHGRVAEAVASLCLCIDGTSRISPEVLDGLCGLEVWLEPLARSLGDALAQSEAALAARPAGRLHLTLADAAGSAASELATTKSQVQAQALAMAYAQFQQTQPLSTATKDSSSISAAAAQPHALEALGSEARKLLGVDAHASSAFSIAPIDLSAQTVGDVVADAGADLANPHHPKTLRGRAWALVHVPSSSAQALGLRVFLLACIVVSVLLLYSQTSPKLALTGEGSDYCQAVVAAYCSDKSSKSADPACFVLDEAGSPAEKLSFWCAGSNCFGRGYNFGAATSARSCSASVLGQPFQSRADLLHHYGAPSMLTPRARFQQLSAVCSRLECSASGAAAAAAAHGPSPTQAQTLARGIWYYSEFVVSVVFAAEALLRVWVAPALREHAANALTWVDAAAVLPFFAEVGYAAGTPFVDFAVLPSAPLPAFLTFAKALKITRLLKAARYLRASKVLWDTARRALPQLGAALGLLAAGATLVAVLMFEVEQGRACFVGADASSGGCRVPVSLAASARVGDRVVVNAAGGASRFDSVLSSAWFAFVTVTSTGLGDAAPLTFGGRVLNLGFMLASLCFAAFPLTVAASTFHHFQQRAQDSEFKAVLGERSKRARQRADEQRALRALTGTLTTLRLLQLRLAALLALLRSPPADVATARRIIELPLTAEKSWLLSEAASVVFALEAALLGCRRDVYVLSFRLQKRMMEVRAALATHGALAPRSL